MTGSTLVGLLFCVTCMMVTCANETGCPKIGNENGPSVPVITDNSTVDDVMMYSQEQTLTLSCCVRGQPKPNITWLKDNAPLLPSLRLQLMNDNQELRISRLLPVDSGEYMCIAKNSYGSSNYTIYMDIRIEPGRDLPPKIDMYKSWKVVVGHNVTLVCHVFSQYRPIVSWSKAVNSTLSTYLPSNPLKRDNEFLGKYTLTLTITNVSLKDAGVYKCQAKNGAGEIIPEKKGTLTVIEEKEKIVADITSAPKVTLPSKTRKYVPAVAGGGLALLVVILFVVALVYIKRYKPEGWVTRKLIQMGVVKPPNCLAETHGEHGDDECSCCVTWDVFVSYDNKDREWVMNVLHKKMTKAYRVCIDVPGTGVVDNIARCVWRSKTTLFVVSRDFLESGWSKLVEFEITQEKIRRAQGSLVVIMLEDIKWKNLPPILRRYTTGNMRVDRKSEWLRLKEWLKLKSLLGPSINPKENVDGKDTPMTATSEEEYRLIAFETSA